MVFENLYLFVLTLFSHSLVQYTPVFDSKFVIGFDLEKVLSLLVDRKNSEEEAKFGLEKLRNVLKQIKDSGYSAILLTRVGDIKKYLPEGIYSKNFLAIAKCFHAEGFKVLVNEGHAEEGGEKIPDKHRICKALAGNRFVFFDDNENNFSGTDHLVTISRDRSRGKKQVFHALDALSTLLDKKLFKEDVAFLKSKTALPEKVKKPKVKEVESTQRFFSQTVTVTTARSTVTTTVVKPV